jgi:formate C-acetyltransferase
MQCSSVLSAQEERIQNEIAGKGAQYRLGRERVYAILDSFQSTKPKIDVERARYFTQSMRQTEGQPLILRWAKALKNVAENITVYIDDHQLLAGRIGYQGRYGILYPELEGDFYDAFVESLDKREKSPFDVKEDDKRILLQEVCPYWKGKTFHEALNIALPQETRELTYDDKDGLKSRYIINETCSFRSSLQWVHDFNKVLTHGFTGLRASALAQIDALDPIDPRDNTERKPFLEAIVIVFDALILWAKRHAVLAAEKAATELSAVRKAELLEMAKICAYVAENKPRTLHEAIQAQWFTQMFSRLEQKTGTIVSNGRMDQYFYPFFKRDIESGIMDEQKATELFECMWVGMAQFLDLHISPAGDDFSEGYAHWEAVTVGGQTSEGEDASNELTYLLLRSKREFPLHYPDLAARIHSRAPERYLYEVAETLKEGSGYPKLINDEEVIPLYLAKGATFEEIYDYAVSGCAEVRMPNRDTYTSGCPFINFGAILEMTLRNGKMKKFDDKLLGIAAGDPRDCQTWEDFWELYKAQQINTLKNAFIQQCTVIRLREQYFGAPLASALHDLCMKNCKNLHAAYIEGGIDFGYFDAVGFGTVVDSLAVIKKFVFEDKSITMDQLLEALDNNFENDPLLQYRLKKAPTYGNADPYADSIGKSIDRISVEFSKKYAKSVGVNLDWRMVPQSAHVPFGKVVSATPNGRKAWTKLSDGGSCSQGVDSNGPTATMLSCAATKNMAFKERAARLFNIKLSPKCVAGQEGTQKLVSLLRTFCDLKLWHLQFNIINRETMIAAQKEPEKYRGLIVRIAGYSAYFVDLSEDLQDDLISRTEHQHVC